MENWGEKRREKENNQAVKKKKKAELECLDHSSPGRNSIKRGLLLLILLSMGYILTEKDLSRWKVSVFPPGEGVADI